MLNTEWEQWIAHNLDRGCTPQALIEAMVQEQVESAVAVEAVHRALAGRAAPSEAFERPRTGLSMDCWPHGCPFLSAHDLTCDEGHAVRLLARLDSPAVMVLDNVLSAQECEYLIAIARARLTRSTVVNPCDGQHVEIADRSSDGAWFERAQTPELSRIEARLARIMATPVDHGEGIQVLHYGVGGEYRPHHDYFPPDERGSEHHLLASGQRTASLIMYLNGPEAGGETLFPQAGFRCIPRRGMGLYFAYTSPQGWLDPASLHGGVSVAAGEKWIATKWVRERAY